jgi:hypothetical protein
MFLKKLLLQFFQMISVNVIVNLVVLFCVIVLTAISFKFLKMDRNSILMFIFYTMFWFPVMLLRQYAHTLWTASGLSRSGIDFFWFIPIYGLVGVAVRWAADYFTYKFSTRKAFLISALLIQVVLYLVSFINQSVVSLYLQMFAVGFAASAIGIFNLMFSEQNHNKSIFGVIGLFALPPLIADLLSSPVQSILISLKDENGKPYSIEFMKYMWLIASFICLISVAVSFLIKENRQLVKVSLANQQIPPTNKNKVNFILLMFIGLFVTLSKFLTSGTYATWHLQTISNNGSYEYESYMSALFTIGQIIGIILCSLMSRKIKENSVFGIGIGIWIVFYILNIINTNNGVLYFSFQFVNGLGYGIIYNIVAIMVLRSNWINKKYAPFGIYQTFLAIGILSSSFIGNTIKESHNSPNYLSSILIQNSALLGVAILSLFLFLLTSTKIRKKNIR